MVPPQPHGGILTGELEGVPEHYERLLAEHGDTPRGADYRDEASQVLRFRRLDRLVLGHDVGSVCDLGCGYGAYLDHLEAAAWSGSYVGVDVTPGMIDRARTRHPDVRFEVGTAPVAADAVVASGIFNVRFGSDEAWEALVRRTIEVMWDAAEIGIAFNLLSATVVTNRYTVEPDVLAGWLGALGGRRTTIDHDVGTHELTAIVLT